MALARLSRKPLAATTHGTTNAAKGYAIGISAAFVLSLTGIFIALASRRHGVPALVIAVWRDVFTCMAIGSALLVRAPRLLAVHRKDMGFLAVNGAILAVFNIFWTLSVVKNGAAAATLLVYSSGGFTVILERILRGERIGPFKAAAIAASLLGAALVSGAFGGSGKAPDPIGIATGLASGLAYAVYSLVGKGGARRGLSPWTSVCWSFGVAALLLLALRALPAGLVPAQAIGKGELFMPGRPAEAWLILVLLAAGPTALGFGLYNLSLGYLPAGTANLLASLEPVFTTVVAWSFLGERLGISAAIGAACTLGAVGLLWLADASTRKGDCPPASAVSAPRS